MKHKTKTASAKEPTMLEITEERIIRVMSELSHVPFGLFARAKGPMHVDLIAESDGSGRMSAGVFEGFKRPLAARSGAMLIGPPSTSPLPAYEGLLVECQKVIQKRISALSAASGLVEAARARPRKAAKRKVPA